MGQAVRPLELVSESGRSMLVARGSRRAASRRPAARRRARGRWSASSAGHRQCTRLWASSTKRGLFTMNIKRAISWGTDWNGEVTGFWHRLAPAVGDVRPLSSLGLSPAALAYMSSGSYFPNNRS